MINNIYSGKEAENRYFPALFLGMYTMWFLQKANWHYATKHKISRSAIPLLGLPPKGIVRKLWKDICMWRTTAPVCIIAQRRRHWSYGIPWTKTIHCPLKANAANLIWQEIWRPLAHTEKQSPEPQDWWDSIHVHRAFLDMFINSLITSLTSTKAVLTPRQLLLHVLSKS